MKSLEIFNFENNTPELFDFLRTQIDLDRAEREKLETEYIDQYEKMKTQQANRPFLFGRRKKEDDSKDGTITEPINEEMKTPEEFMAEQRFLSDILKCGRKENIQCRSQ